MMRSLMSATFSECRLVFNWSILMHRAVQHKRSMGWHLKFLFTVLALLCVIVGLIGLVLPVIPGVVFLVVAVLLLSRVSPRLARWAKRRPELNRLQNRFNAMGRMSWRERIRFSFWMAMSGILQGAVYTRSIISRGVRTIRSRSSRRANQPG